MFESICRVLPADIKPICRHLCNSTEEIRLRSGLPPYLVKRGVEYAVQDISAAVTPAHLDQILQASCGGSRYTVNESLQNGFLTLPGGHRMGVCGEAVWQRERCCTFRVLSSVSIRLAREHKGCGTPLSVSTLILGAPGSGKTSLLRDCVRILSDECGARVCLADERGEIAGCREGVAQLEVGRHTDVLTGLNKADAVLMLLKTMNPQWIALDEITGARDAEAVTRVSYCGVKILATAHAEAPGDLCRREVYRQLLKNRCFERILMVERDHSYRVLEVPEL